MRVVYQNYPIYTTSGTLAGVLDGEYDARPSTGQQPGWHALHKVDASGNVSPEVAANVHIVGVTTT